MTQADFVDLVLEELFVRGLNCHVNPLRAHLQLGWGSLQVSDGPAAFADSCIHALGITFQPEPQIGESPSPTAGARDRCLAIHEAGHAVVGLKAGLVLRGIRFCGDQGFPGEAGFELFDWGSCTDQRLLCDHLRVDVAANLAEIAANNCKPEGGVPSEFFATRRPQPDEQYPTDIIGAWKLGRHLATVRAEKAGQTLADEETWNAAREIIQKAEKQANDVLRANLIQLNQLADGLMRGPMTGTAVRLIVGK